MAHLDRFTLFPNLPTELRLSIYTCMLPHRVLQLGLDNGAPYPFPDKQDTPSLTECFFPFRCTLPITFRLCRESRHFSLSTYVPFAFTYIHPILDVLYISCRAALVLYHNMAKGKHNGKWPALYPLALVDTIAVEFERDDLPTWAVGKQKQNQTWSQDMAPTWSLYAVIKAFKLFGPPKHLLLVRGLSRPGRDSGHLGPVWERIELMEWDPKVDSDWVKAALDFMNLCLEINKRDNLWLNWRLPEVGIAGIKAEGETVLEKKQRIQWIRAKIQTITARTPGFPSRNWDIDFEPYCKENMEMALARVRRQLM